MEQPAVAPRHDCSNQTHMGELEMMKKTTSALAIAALLGTGAATAATFQIDDNTTFSVAGDVEFSFVDEEGSTNTRISDEGTEVNFSGEHTSDNGLTTFFNLEVSGFDITGDITDTNDSEGKATGNDGDLNSDDDGFVGVRGAFGSVAFGNVTTAFDALADITDVMEDAGVSTKATGARAQNVQYQSPEFNGVSFVVDTQIAADGDDAETQSEETSVRVDVDLDMATVMLGYDTAKGTSGIGATTSLSGVDLGAKFQTGSDNNLDVIGVTAGTTLAGLNLYGVFNRVDDNGDTANEVAAGVSYPVADNLVVHAEMSQLDAANDVGDTFAVGAHLKF